MQTKKAVVERAMALGVMSLRSQCENGINYREDDGAEERFTKRGRALLEWVRDQGIDKFFSKEERKLHRKKLGNWTYDDIAERFWRIESFKAVLWCVQILEERPSYFEVGPVKQTYDLLPEGEDVGPFVKSAKWRPKKEIRKERDFVHFLNWRCRTEMLRLQGFEPPDGDSYEQVVARALPTIDEEGYPVEHDGVDILIGGVRFTELDEEKGETMSICYERHLALEWVLSKDDWDDAHANT